MESQKHNAGTKIIAVIFAIVIFLPAIIYCVLAFILQKLFNISSTYNGAAAGLIESVYVAIVIYGLLGYYVI